MKKQNRRSFLQFLGRTGLVVGAGSNLVTLQSCTGTEQGNLTEQPVKEEKTKSFPIKGIEASSRDTVSLSKGLDYEVLISWDDPISNQDRFGSHNDYLAFLPLDNSKDGLLWVNHEYLQPLLVSAYAEEDPMNKTKEQVEKEMYTVGGSIVRIQQGDDGKWTVKQNDAYNRRLTAQTMIPFNWDEAIEGKKEAMGTFANCSGGVTPWGTILTCEENYDMFYGERVYDEEGKSSLAFSKYGHYGWTKYYDNPPEHYGWVVEVNLKTGEAQKHIALGRCAHECATVHSLADGRVVVYTGDDANDEHLYKFVSSKPNSLKEGTLYVANTEKGEWIAVDYASNPLLQEKFKNQTEVLVRLREAAKLLGATPLHRPEDIEIDPIHGHVLVSLTNNKKKGDYLGQILKIEEDSADKTGTTFKASTYLAGGEDTGFACPDNMAFDPKGNLWFTSDISGSSIGKEPYLSFGNNGLFMVPSYGEDKGKVIQVAAAPNDAEFTGPFFAPDGETLFLSVQHPGERTTDIAAPTSIWPGGEGTLPKSSVICISGPALKELMQA